MTVCRRRFPEIIHASIFPRPRGFMSAPRTRFNISSQVICRPISHSRQRSTCVAAAAIAGSYMGYRSRKGCNTSFMFCAVPELAQHFRRTPFSSVIFSSDPIQTCGVFVLKGKHSIFIVRHRLRLGEIPALQRSALSVQKTLEFCQNLRYKSWEHWHEIVNTLKPFNVIIWFANSDISFHKTYLYLIPKHRKVLKIWSRQLKRNLNKKSCIFSVILLFELQTPHCEV